MNGIYSKKPCALHLEPYALCLAPFTINLLAILPLQWRCGWIAGLPP
jgi:hypothetical protein